MTYRRLVSVVAVGFALSARSAWAQGNPTESAKQPSTEPVTQKGEAPVAEGEAPPDSVQNEPTAEAVDGEAPNGAASEEDKLVADAELGGSPVELPGRTYYFVGARYRLIVVPKFIVGLFGDGGKTVSVQSGGAEFGIRKDGFEYNFGAWLAAYSMDPTTFKAKSDGEDAWELVESKIKILYLTADFMWTHDFSPEFGLNYGMGAGLGLVFGPLIRNQAYRAADGSYQECTGPGNPAVADYCGGDNDHYNDYEEPSWADGGSKPVVFPWLAVQTGFRYKPHRNFVARLDAGFGLSGFFIGVGGDYGL
ncbi:MAG: hypothetical protein M3020_00115 [Myxococcota bacterium]|nr:hypothetical protein [Myxococcota bacterium]